MHYDLPVRYHNAFTALLMLTGRQEGHLVQKNFCFKAPR